MKVEATPTQEAAPAGGEPGGNALQRELTAAFAGALVVVIALALSVFHSAREALDASRSVARSQEVLRTMARVEAELVRAESAVRGFIITGENIFLDDRDSAMSLLESGTARLGDLTIDNASQQQRWRILRGRLDERLALLHRIALIRQIEGAEAARRFLSSASPRAVMRGISGALEEMRQEERQLLGERVQREERRRTLAVIGGLALTVLFVLLFTLGYLAIRRQIVQTVDARRRFEDEAAWRRALLESAPDAVVVSGRGGKIVLVNARTEQLFGYAREELIGQSIETLVPERFRDRHVAHRADYAAAPRSRYIMAAGLELYGRRKDESEFPADITLSPIPLSQGLLVFGNIRDATERKEDERKLRELNAGLKSRTEEVEAANRELEGFSYSVSHDLRAPLRAIDGFSRMLTEDYGERMDEEGRRRLEVLRRNSQKMGQLIDDLLDFSRLGKKPLACSTIDMTALADEVCRELRAAHSGGSPVFDLAPLPEAWGDPAMLRQVLANLLSNSLKYVRKGLAPRIEVRGRADGADNIYCVKDAGVGFDMAYYEKLFGVFQRLHSDREFPGTGVGLAIVQRVVQRHGGRVWAESKPNEGSTFYFSLPKAAVNGVTDPPAATGGLK